MQRRWTEDEIAYLRDHSTKEPRAVIAAHLGRSHASLSKKLQRFDFGSWRPMNPWTDAEDDFIRRNYGKRGNGKKSAKEIAAELGRTRSAVGIRACKLGVGRNCRTTYRGDMRLCRRCNEYKNRNEFPKNARMSDGLHSWCNECHRQYNRLRTHKYNILGKYGIGVEHWRELYATQHGKCASCGQAIGDRGCKAHHVAHVDHDHVTGQVRGLLCYKCNALLGYAGDSVDILKSAIAYLWRSRLRVREAG